MEQRFFGIDLGTSNSAIAQINTEQAKVEALRIPQVVGQESSQDLFLLPSFLYRRPESEQISAALPWEKPQAENLWICGQYAKNLASTNPERVISSAKSWLCNHFINRSQPILPWKSEQISDKLSPVEASQALLQHLFQSLQFRFPDYSCLDYPTVITIPASFDEIARTLSQQAANNAGFSNIRMLEEPLAAFYNWIAQNEDLWRKQINPGETVLVCDVGGGTTDFSLIRVQDNNGNLELERVAVGEHILLGGDNMDLTLAYSRKRELEETGVSLDAWQFRALIDLARQAKEALCSDPELQNYPISIPARGSDMFASAVETNISKDEINQVLMLGFFPITDSLPHKRATQTIQELGLSYASDPAITKHLIAFLKRCYRLLPQDQLLSKQSTNEILIPDAVLFNGGVFKAQIFRQRILDCLGELSKTTQLRELVASDLELAVAQGAAYYARLCANDTGIRIKASSSHSFYLGIESGGLAVPGFENELKALCIAPLGMEEGSSVVAGETEFLLTLGEQLSFEFFSSSERQNDRAGQILDSTKTLTACGKASLKVEDQELSQITAIPVKIRCELGASGVLELWLQHSSSAKSWKVELRLSE